MRKPRVVFLVESVVVLASVVVAYATRWRMPFSPWIAAPVGLILWGAGLIFSLRLRGEMRKAVDRRIWPKQRRGYPFIEARAAMHLGVALGFRSWPTLIVAAACAVVNLGMAATMRHRLRSRLGVIAPFGEQPSGW